MDKKILQDAVAKLRESTQKRKFEQTVDLVANLKDLNLKKPEEQVDFYMQLPHDPKRTLKICGLVGPELIEESKKHLHKTLTVSDFEKLTKQDIKKLADEFDFFIAQATIMPKIAQTFGRVFGPRNKMPNPKAGCVVPPKANLQPIVERLQYTIRLRAKSAPIIQVPLGKESLSDDQLVENLDSAIEQLIHHLPKEVNNLKTVMIKLTMGQAIKVL
ncbi:MAG: hypothetical protein ACMXYF_04985 [Candidatus Woesearchaeota archaeon]